MNLLNKKRLAAETLNVGAGRIKFNNERLSEIKDAITRQDILDLVKSKAIEVKEIRGRKRKYKRKKKGFGNIRKKVKTRKQDYVILTRKLRAYVKELKKQGRITKDQYYDIRRRIRARIYKSKSHLKSLLE
ncbi:hypothetical protein HYV49_01610 [Candidatus Pacearchaeota archaeon]|nr:hypothetical protein [Candidatus Pacearchaeota archaeon]